MPGVISYIFSRVVGLVYGVDMGTQNALSSMIMRTRQTVFALVAVESHGVGK